MDEATKQYIDDELKKHGVLIESYGINTEQLAVAIAAIAEVARLIVTRINESFGIIFDEYNFSLIQDERLAYKLDFTRPVIKHQVMDRKPRHLIKKIIR